MKIRGEALELALRIVLSCPCPVTNDEERQVFDYLRGLTPDEVADYAPVLAIFEATDTPFHGLADFTGWMAPGQALSRPSSASTSCAATRPATTGSWPRRRCRRTRATSPRSPLAALAHGYPGSCWRRGRRSDAGGVPLRGRLRRRSTTSFCRPSSIRTRRRRGRSISAPSSVRWALPRPRSSRSWARRIRSWCCTAAASRASITPTSSSWATTASSAARVTRRTSVAHRPQRPETRAGVTRASSERPLALPRDGGRRAPCLLEPRLLLEREHDGVLVLGGVGPPSSGSACPRIESRT